MIGAFGFDGVVASTTTGPGAGCRATGRSSRKNKAKTINCSLREQQCSVSTRRASVMPATRNTHRLLSPQLEECVFLREGALGRLGEALVRRPHSSAPRPEG